MNADYIAPSILAADFACLGDEVRAVVEAGANLIHFDVMDNHYVPNLTIGPGVCKSLCGYISRSGLDIEIDAHLMVNPVEALVDEFAQAGASIISVHPEVCTDVGKTVAAIRQQGCKAGLVFNPEMSLAGLDAWLEDIDLVLIMSVNPGFGGQAFIEDVLPKVEQARELIDRGNGNQRLEVDGGITLENIAAVAAAGADTFVAGSTIYRSADYAETIAGMRSRIAAVRAAAQ